MAAELFLLCNTPLVLFLVTPKAHRNQGTVDVLYINITYLISLYVDIYAGLSPDAVYFLTHSNEGDNYK